MMTTVISSASVAEKLLFASLFIYQLFSSMLFLSCI